MELEGRVTSGFGRGSDYVGMDAYRERFRDAVGFDPFPGTLNIETDPEAKRALQAEADPREIPSFSVDGEEYSAVTAYPVTVDGVEAALLEMAITDHPDAIAELIAPANLRETLDLADGDVVTCRTI